MNTAEEVMRNLNANAMIGEEADGRICFIEDIDDPDGRLYRIEVQSDPDGTHAIAFCRSNPWGGVAGGESYEEGHVDGNGFICVGDEHESQTLEDSSYDVGHVIQRAHYWCTAFSVLKETGEFPNP